MSKAVSFYSEGVKLAGDLFLPADVKPGDRGRSLLRGSGAGRRDRCAHRRCSQPAAPIYFPTTFRSASLMRSCQPGPAS